MEQDDNGNTSASKMYVKLTEAEKIKLERKAQEIEKKEKFLDERRRLMASNKAEELRQKIQSMQLAEYKEQDEYRAKAADQFMWLNFESKMRTMVEDLLAPIVVITNEERTNNLQLIYKCNELDDRAQKLEHATFKIDKFNNPDKYLESLEKRIEFLELSTVKDLKKVSDESNLNRETLENRFFILDQSIKQCLKLQECVDREADSSRQIKLEANQLRDKVFDMIQNLQVQVNHSFTAIQSEQFKTKVKCQDFQVRLGVIDETLKSQSEKNRQVNDQIVKKTIDIQQLSDKKYDRCESDGLEKRLIVLMKRLEWKNEELKNEVKSLENWVEKYVPLRLQHQIGQSVQKFLSKKHQRKFQDQIDRRCDELRTEVMKDVGIPRLQQKCLSILSDMRLEEDLLMEKKNKKLQKITEVEQVKERQWSPTGQSNLEARIRKTLGQKTTELTIPDEYKVPISSKRKSQKATESVQRVVIQQVNELTTSSDESELSQKSDNQKAQQTQMSLFERVQQDLENRLFGEMTSLKEKTQSDLKYLAISLRAELSQNQEKFQVQLSDQISEIQTSLLQIQNENSAQWQAGLKLNRDNSDQLKKLQENQKIIILSVKDFEKKSIDAHYALQILIEQAKIVESIILNTQDVKPDGITGTSIMSMIVQKQVFQNDLLQVQQSARDMLIKQNDQLKRCSIILSRNQQGKGNESISGGIDHQIRSVVSPTHFQSRAVSEGNSQFLTDEKHDPVIIKQGLSQNIVGGDSRRLASRTIERPHQNWNEIRQTFTNSTPRQKCYTSQRATRSPRKIEINQPSNSRRIINGFTVGDVKSAKPNLDLNLIVNKLQKRIGNSKTDQSPGLNITIPMMASTSAQATVEARMTVHTNNDFEESAEKQFFSAREQ